MLVEMDAEKQKRLEAAGWQFGSIQDLLGLSDEDKLDALERAADAKGIGIAQGVLLYLITHYRRDMQSLTHMLSELDHYSLETKRPITLPLLRELLHRKHQENLEPSNN